MSTLGLATAGNVRAFITLLPWPSLAAELPAEETRGICLHGRYIVAVYTFNQLSRLNIIIHILFILSLLKHVPDEISLFKKRCGQTPILFNFKFKY